MSDHNQIVGKSGKKYNAPIKYELNQINAIITYINVCIDRFEESVIIEPVSENKDQEIVTKDLGRRISLLIRLVENSKQQVQMGYCLFLFARYTLWYFKPSMRDTCIKRAEHFYEKNNIDYRDLLTYDSFVPSLNYCTKKF